jgi:hypothetical protein
MAVDTDFINRKSVLELAENLNYSAEKFDY